MSMSTHRSLVSDCQWAALDDGSRAREATSKMAMEEEHTAQDTVIS